MGQLFILLVTLLIGINVFAWDNPAASQVSGTSRNAPRIETIGGQKYLSEHGNRRPLNSVELASAQKYIDDFWRQYPTGYQRESDRIVEQESHNLQVSTSVTDRGPQIRTVNGETYLLEHGNVRRLLSPTEIADAQAYVNRMRGIASVPPPPDESPDRYETVR